MSIRGPKPTNNPLNPACLPNVYKRDIAPPSPPLPLFI